MWENIRSTDAAQFSLKARHCWMAARKFMCNKMYMSANIANTINWLMWFNANIILLALYAKYGSYYFIPLSHSLKEAIVSQNRIMLANNVSPNVDV